MTGAGALSEFIGAFTAEAEELIATAGRALSLAEEARRRASAHPRGVREAFRALHTIKGLAGMVGVEPVVAIAHRMEASLHAADQGEGLLDLPTFDVLMQGLRAIQTRVQALAEGRPVPEASPALLAALDLLDVALPDLAPQPPPDLAQPLLARLSPSERAQLVAAAPRRAMRVDFYPSPERAAAGRHVTSVREQMAAIAEVVKVLPLSLPGHPLAPTGLGFALLVVTAATDEALAAVVDGGPHSVTPLGPFLAPRAPPGPLVEEEPELADLEPQHGGVVRVEVSRLDEAMDGLSALIVTRFRLTSAAAALAERGVEVRELQAILKDNARQLRDLRRAILRVRLVRAAELLERVPLIVRNLRRTTGKRVRLVLDAGTAELDKTVAERIFPAIIHLVRNAVDHAIEPPEERARLGKPEEGVVRLVCVERSNAQLELTVTDDGRGIDARAVAERAGVAVPRTDGELLELVCRAGLSTRAQATTTSGRGMGMDIVRRVVVDQLGGELSLQTRPGVGTTFSLRVPLSLTIVDAFSFESAAQRYVAPVAAIEEIIELDLSRLVRGPSRGGGGSGAGLGMLERRGEAVPVVRLDRAFGRPDGPPPRKALIVRRAGLPVAFAVDRMLGQQEVVVRPLDDALVKVVGVGGSTDLGDGRPTLVLDLAALASRLLREGAA
jgi:two-component system chemotaxis sensor kinase CheA